MFYVIDEYNVRFSEDRTILIKAPDSLEGEYKVPDSVVAIEKAAFSHCEQLETIVLPPSIQSLGENVFIGCKKLKSVVFTSSITQIGDWCFSECESLEIIDIPLTTEHIGQKTFYNCKSLKKIVIPDNCLCDRCSFEGCESLCDINIPNCWEEIPYSCFYACKGLEHIIIPPSVKKICEAAFANCSALLTVDIGDGVVEIEKNAFDKCENLLQIRFGFNLQKIGDNSFDDCSNLRTVYWDAIECRDFQHTPFEWKNWRGGIDNAPIKHFHFGRSVKRIPSCLCECLDSLEEIEIPDNVEKIGEHAFGRCNPLFIYINKSIRNLKEIFGAYGGIDDDKFLDNIFIYCDRIEEFVVSIHNPYYASMNGNLYNKDFSKLIRVGRKCIRTYERGRERERSLNISTKQIENFAGIGLDITDLSISGCIDIGEFAFYGCRQLKSVSFCAHTPTRFSPASNALPSDEQPNSLRINYFAFGDCPNLEEIYWDVEDGNFPISGSYQIWGWCCGERCTNRIQREYDFSKQISKITVGKNISKLPTFFTYLLNVTELELPINIKEVKGGLPPHLSKLTLLDKGHAAHEDSCDDGRNFLYKDGFVLSKDGSTLFRYIGEFEEIIIPNSVVNIADNALSFVPAKKIVLPYNLVEIGESAFEHSSIESFCAPDSLLSIHKRAFKDCYGLTALRLNSSLQYIDYEAFKNCIKLERITIPNATEYKDDILKGCSSLQELCIASDNLDLTGLTSLHKVIWDVKGEEECWKFDMFAKEVHYGSGNTYYDKENSIAHKIETLILTDNVERIPRNFAKCMQITEVDIPLSVKHIGEEAFYHCPRLEKIILHSMDIEIDEDFCHFNKTRIQFYREFVDCTPTKIFFDGKDVTDVFNKKNKEIVDERRRAETDAADFEQYVRDSFYGAYEGEWDPNGDDW